VNGGKFPAIREHLEANIAGAYKDMDISYVSFLQHDLTVLSESMQLRRVSRGGKG
jgi:hypothetical protein